MEDELDQIIENAVSGSDDQPSPEETDESPDLTNATDESADPDVPEVEDVDTEIVDSDSQDEELPSTSDGTAPNPEPDPNVISRAEYEDLRRQYEETQRIQEGQRKLIAAAVENARKSQEDRQYKDLLDRLEDMDTDEAIKEHTRFMTDRFNERQTALVQENQRLTQQIEESKQAQQLAAYEAAEADAKLKTIEIISDRFKLTDFEKSSLDLLSGPEAMEEFARRAQVSRQERTKAAREAKRQSIEENPALRTGGATGSAPENKPEFKDLDDVINFALRSA
jgi:uncharacterized phage infection (PIP) family protein YhgE